MKSRNIEININKVFAISFPEGVRFLYVFVSSKLFLMFAVYLLAVAVVHMFLHVNYYFLHVPITVDRFANVQY
jgi:hypothetical protein